MKELRFTGDIYAMPGTVAFPQEVLLRVQTKKDEALLLETCMSMIMNHEKPYCHSSPRSDCCQRGNLMEFGLRRSPQIGWYLWRSFGYDRLQWD